MLELKHRGSCVWKIQHEGACREANTGRGKAECCICLKTPPPSAVFFKHASTGGALTVILYFLVVWLRTIFSSSQTAATFGDQDISKSLTSLFLVVEQTNRISLVSSSNYNVTYVIHRAELVESCLKSFVIRRSVSLYTIYS